MIIYNVTIKVENSIADGWVRWMKTEHMADLMNTGLFVDCRLCRLLEQDETDGVTDSAQYFCDSLEQYNTYINEYSKGMRSKMSQLFGERLVAFRTIMEII